MLVMFFSLTSYSSPLSKEELKKRGKSAYEENNCLDTVKYLFAYLIVEEQMAQEDKINIEVAITYCENVLAPVKTVAGWAPGTMGVLSAGGSLKPLKLGTGGVLVTSGGDLRTIDTSTGGVLITNEGVLKKASEYAEYFSTNKSNYLTTFEEVMKNEDVKSLELLIKKKNIELDALGNLQSLYNSKLNTDGLMNGSSGFPNAELKLENKMGR